MIHHPTNDDLNTFALAFKHQLSQYSASSLQIHDFAMNGNTYSCAFNYTKECNFPHVEQ